MCIHQRAGQVPSPRIRLSLARATTGRRAAQQGTCAGHGAQAGGSGFRHRSQVFRPRDRGPLGRQCRAPDGAGCARESRGQRGYNLSEGGGEAFLHHPLDKHVVVEVVVVLVAHEGYLQEVLCGRRGRQGSEMQLRGKGLSSRGAFVRCRAARFLVSSSRSFMRVREKSTHLGVTGVSFARTYFTMKMKCSMPTTMRSSSCAVRLGKMLRKVRE